MALSSDAWRCRRGTVLVSDLPMLSLAATVVGAEAVALPGALNHFANPKSAASPRHN